jgi:hypothetical protein
MPESEQRASKAVRPRASVAARARQAPWDLHADPGVAVVYRGVAGVSRGGPTHTALPGMPARAAGPQGERKTSFSTTPQAYATPVDA